MRSITLLAVVALTWPTQGKAHDLVLSERQGGALHDLASLAKSVKTPEAVESGEVAGIRRNLSAFTQHEREDLPECAAFRSLPANEQAVVQRWLAADAWLESLAPVVPSPWVTACRLNSDNPSDVASAILDLGSSEFNGPWVQVVTRMASDSRPVVRLGGGVLAKVGTLFVGPREPFERIARNLVTDRDPDVAAKFAVAHVYDFHLHRLMDLLFERLKDGRRISGADGVLRSVGPTVGESVLVGLRQNLFSWRTRYHETELSRSEASEVGEVGLSAWWKQHRATWRFTPPREKWRTSLDTAVTLVPGASQSVGDPAASINIRLEECRFWTEGLDWPRHTLAAELCDGGGNMELRIGNPDHEFGWVAKASAGDAIAEAIAIPGPGRSVRIRLWLWRESR